MIIRAAVHRDKLPVQLPERHTVYGFANKMGHAQAAPSVYPPALPYLVVWCCIRGLGLGTCVLGWRVDPAATATGRNVTMEWEVRQRGGEREPGARGRGEWGRSYQREINAD